MPRNRSRNVHMEFLHGEFGDHRMLLDEFEHLLAEDTASVVPGEARRALIPAALCAYMLLGVSMHALAFPVFEGDAFSIWGLKAKQVFSQPLLPRPDVFSDPSLGYAHARYPLMLNRSSQAPVFCSASNSLPVS